MGYLGVAGNGGIWGMGPFHHNFRRRSNKKRESKPSNSVDSAAAGGYQFPLQQAATSSVLCLTGDTIAQLRHRWVRNKDTLANSGDIKVREREREFWLMLSLLSSECCEFVYLRLVGIFGSKLNLWFC